jgi:hypothetical protein
MELSSGTQLQERLPLAQILKERHEIFRFVFRTAPHRWHSQQSLFMEPDAEI